MSSGSQSAPSSPIIAILSALAAGELTLEQALARAAAPEVAGRLTPAEAGYLSRTCSQRAFQGQWRLAAGFQQTLLAALDAAPEDHFRVRAAATLDWLDIVTLATMQVPDGRLFRKAAARGEALLGDACERQDRDLEGRLLHSLGVLHLDPYAGGRSSANYAQQLNLWRQALDREYGLDLIDVPPEELAVPAVPGNFDTAAAYLRRAAAVRTGVLRGESLKALAEANFWKEVAGGTSAREESVAAAREALKLLGAEDRPGDIAALENLLRLLGASQPQAAGEAEEDPLLWADVELEERQRGLIDLIDRYTQGASRHSGKPLSISIWDRAAALIEASGTEEQRSAYLMQGMRLLAAAYRRDSGPLGLLARAALSTSTNTEAEGLELLEQARGSAHPFVASHPALIAYSGAMLHLGEAVNLVESGRQLDQAIDHYWSAAALHAQLRMSGSAIDVLQRLLDLTPRAEATGLVMLVGGLVTSSVSLENLAGEAATRALQALCQAAMQRAASLGGMNPSLLICLWQVAKGMRFASAWAAETMRGVAAPDQLREMLDLIEERERQLGYRWRTPRAGLSDVDMLQSYAMAGEVDPGEEPAAQIEALQGRFDDALQKWILRDAPAYPPLFTSFEEVQQQLGEGTVLLNYLLAPSPRGMMAVYILALTRDEEMLTMGESGSFPHALIEMKSGNIVVRCHPLGLSVSALREAVAGNSLSMIETLKNDAHTLFGPIREKLARWREQGKDHLCVVPHGPLHYYPFHLLGEEEAPLAADWAVTYLPNLCMLRATPAVSDGVTAALGISWQFQNPFGLTPLPGAALEAQAIAQVTGRPAILERAATKKVFLDTLGRTARIHLATHARHRAAAPAFQSLHLAPAQGSDGELCAHEITGLDLRHVDLVTLGACETALSRFDSADNLRGLAPALLQAGVRSIIGTLWPAPDEPARTFFAAFYQGLQNGRPKAYAFHDAQLQTRDAFPDYRDWGGFYFMGEAG